MGIKHRLAHLHSIRLMWSTASELGLSFNYFRCEIFDFQTMINPILEMAIQKSELWNLKSEIWNQNSEIRNRKSQFLKIWNPQLRNRNQKLDFRNATCDIQFWKSRFIPVYNVIISNIESVKSSTFPLREWVSRFECYFRYRFSKRGKGEYFLTSCFNNFSRKWGKGEVNVGRQFPPLFKITLRRIESFRLL